MIHTVFVGDMGQQVEKKNILSALGHCSSSAQGIPHRGQCLYFKHSSDAEWSLERECEGCWHPQ